MDLWRASLNTTRRHAQTIMEAERYDRTESKQSTLRISLPRIEIKKNERSGTQLARHLDSRPVILLTALLTVVWHEHIVQQ